MPPVINVIGSPITALRLEEQIPLMAEWAQAHESRVVCVANVHMVMEAHRDPSFAAVLRGADLVTADGMPLVWMMRRLGAPNQDRLAGLDIFHALCQAASERQVGIYFLGSTQEVLDRMREQLEREYPRLMIAGMASPPFRPLSREEEEALAETINRSGAGLVFVAFGCPKQERWMAEQRGRIQAVMVGLGGAFPVYAGLQKRAARWVREAGLEWAFRLVQEPRRLWGRYWETNLPFIRLALQQLIAHRLARGSR